MKTRITVQKIKILEYLKSVKTHPTAEQVYEAVKKELPTITLATVYRNLNLLAEQDEIIRIEINGGYRYDGDVKHHQHCVCKKCGKISDSCKPEITKYALKKLKTKNFQPSSVNVIFYGVCKNCKGGNMKHDTL